MYVRETCTHTHDFVNNWHWNFCYLLHRAFTSPVSKLIINRGKMSWRLKFSCFYVRPPVFCYWSVWPLSVWHYNKLWTDVSVSLHLVRWSCSVQWQWQTPALNCRRYSIAPAQHADSDHVARGSVNGGGGTRGRERTRTVSQELPWRS